MERKKKLISVAFRFAEDLVEAIDREIAVRNIITGEKSTRTDVVQDLLWLGLNSEMGHYAQMEQKFSHEIRNCVEFLDDKEMVNRFPDIADHMRDEMQKSIASHKEVMAKIESLQKKTKFNNDK
jgi:hypothetical protein